MSKERLEKYFDGLATDLNNRIIDLEKKLNLGDLPGVGWTTNIAEIKKEIADLKELSERNRLRVDELKDFRHNMAVPRIIDLEKKLDKHIEHAYYLVEGEELVDLNKYDKRIEALEKALFTSKGKNCISILSKRQNDNIVEIADLKEEIWKRAYARTVDINLKEIREVLRELINILSDGTKDQELADYYSLIKKLEGEKSVEVLDKKRRNPVITEISQGASDDSKPSASSASHMEYECISCGRPMEKDELCSICRPHRGTKDLSIRALAEALDPDLEYDAGSARQTELKEQIPVIEYHYKYPNEKGGVTYETKYYDPKLWKIVRREDLEWLFAWTTTLRQQDWMKFDALREKYLKLSQEEHDE